MIWAQMCTSRNPGSTPVTYNQENLSCGFEKKTYLRVIYIGNQTINGRILIVKVAANPFNATTCRSLLHSHSCSF